MTPDTFAGFVMGLLGGSLFMSLFGPGWGQAGVMITMLLAWSAQ
jgi:hypothetical protein